MKSYTGVVVIGGGIYRASEEICRGDRILAQVRSGRYGYTITRNIFPAHLPA
jgi:hypothetical protein